MEASPTVANGFRLQSLPFLVQIETLLTNWQGELFNSICMPKMAGTVQAARELQAVQAVMYLKAMALVMEGYGHCRANARAASGPESGEDLRK